MGCFRCDPLINTTMIYGVVGWLDGVRLLIVLETNGAMNGP